MKKTGEVERFSSLKLFYDKYPQFEAHSDNVDNYLSRKKLERIAKKYSEIEYNNDNYNIGLCVKNH